MFDEHHNPIRLAGKAAGSLVWVTIVAFTRFLIVPSATLANWQPGSESTSTLDAGFEFLYDLNFDAAHAEFSHWKARHPDDPMGLVAAASAYLFREFDRLGVLQSELFRSDQTFRPTVEEAL
jgi:hypothetical protein